MFIEEVAIRLGRSVDSVKVKAKRLRLRHTPEQTHEILSKRTTGEKNGMFGREGPRRGVKLSKQQKAVLREKMRERFRTGQQKPMRGPDNPQYGKPSPMRGRHLPASAKTSLSRQAKERWEQRTPAYRDAHLKKMREGWAAWARRGTSKLEGLVRNWLQDAGVEHIYQVRVGFYVVDFLLGSTVLEVQGDYWHGNPTKYETLDKTQKANVRRDKAKRTYLTNRGYRLITVWEADVRERPQETRTSLLGDL